MSALPTATIRRTRAHRVAHRLREDIQQGLYSPLTLLPTEFSLCQRYGVSRETLRKSVQTLVKEGHLERIPNRGIQVRGARPALGAPAVVHQISILTPYPYQMTENYYYQGLLSGFAAGSYEYGVSLALVPRRGEALDVLSVAGAVAIWPALPQDLAELYELMEAKRAFVVVGAALDDDQIPAVDCDNQGGTEQALRCLGCHGHRRVGIVGRSHALPADHSQRIVAARRFLKGWEEAVGAVFFTHNDLELPARAEAFRNWIRSNQLTALFTLDLEIAAQVYEVCARLEMNIPGELSVVSFDDARWATALSPALTTVAQPLADIGRRAVERLAEALKNQTVPRGTELLPTKLIERGSVRPVGAPWPAGG